MLSTHVLDTSTGQPAARITVMLFAVDGNVHGSTKPSGKCCSAARSFRFLTATPAGTSFSVAAWLNCSARM